MGNLFLKRSSNGITVLGFYILGHALGAESISALFALLLMILIGVIGDIIGRLWEATQ